MTHPTNERAAVTPERAHELLDLLDEIGDAIRGAAARGEGPTSIAFAVRERFTNRLFDALIDPSPVSPELLERLRKAREETRQQMRAATPPTASAPPREEGLETEVLAIIPREDVERLADDLECSTAPIKNQAARMLRQLRRERDRFLLLYHAALSTGDALAEGVRHARRENALLGVHSFRLPELAERFTARAPAPVPEDADG